MLKGLTIAASDSGGACGIQGDIKTFSALGVYASSVVTSVTAQNTVQMAETFELPTAMVEAQARLVMEDLRPHTVKVGMIGRGENYAALARLFADFHPPHLVVDPVITCYRGCRWVLANDAVVALKASLLPLVDVFALSIPDAEVLLGGSITTVDAMEEAARGLGEWGPRWIVLKGGHLEGDPIDVVWNGERMERLPGRRIVTEHENGSGCAFSTAIAAYLAHGADVPTAIRRAKGYSEGALRSARPVGSGKGPVHHFHAWTDHFARSVEGRRIS